MSAWEACWPWRVGNEGGRTVHIQFGTEPSDADVLIGVMDSPEITASVVYTHNDWLRHQFGKPHRFTATTQPNCQYHKWPNDSIDAICGCERNHPIHLRAAHDLPDWPRHVRVIHDEPETT